MNKDALMDMEREMKSVVNFFWGEVLGGAKESAVVEENVTPIKN